MKTKYISYIINLTYYYAIVIFLVAFPWPRAAVCRAETLENGHIRLTVAPGERVAVAWDRTAAVCTGRCDRGSGRGLSTLIWADHGRRAETPAAPGCGLCQFRRRHGRLSGPVRPRRHPSRGWSLGQSSAAERGGTPSSVCGCF